MSHTHFGQYEFHHRAIGEIVCKKFNQSSGNLKIVIKWDAHNLSIKMSKNSKCICVSNLFSWLLWRKQKMAKLLPTNALTSFQMKCHLCWVQSYLRNEFEFVILFFFSRLSDVELGCRTRCIGTSDVIAHKLFSLYHSIDGESYASLYFIRWFVRWFVRSFNSNNQHISNECLLMK